MEALNPREELKGQALRAAILWCLDGGGRVEIGYHDGQDRMAERNITGGQILASLRSGALTTTNASADGTCRYLARKNDVEVCFCFEVDDEGNVLVIVTLMRV